MYLCHSFCELGGTPLDPVLDDIHTFLVANPGEVLVVINQDYVTPEDFVGGREGRGLDRFVYRGPVGRLVADAAGDDRLQPAARSFLAENHAGAAPWYHPVYDSITQETPLRVLAGAPADGPAMRARELRGQPRPGRARRCSCQPLDHDRPGPAALPRRASSTPTSRCSRALRECQRIRRHFPNLIAVDFYARGDVFRVVDTLNGVPTTR